MGSLRLLLLSVQCPDAKIVLAHAFGPTVVQAVTFSILTMQPGATSNVGLELSALAPLFTSSPFVEQVAWVCRNHGLDRVLWGSDHPPFDPVTSYEALLGSGFGENEVHQVSSLTAKGAAPPLTGLPIRARPRVRVRRTPVA